MGRRLITFVLFTIVTHLIAGVVASDPVPFPCTTKQNETGTCLPFKECYPILNITLVYGSPINAQLQQDILESTTLCKGPGVVSGGGNRTFKDVVCCEDAETNPAGDVITISDESAVIRSSNSNSEEDLESEHVDTVTETTYNNLGDIVVGGNLPVVLPPFQIPLPLPAAVNSIKAPLAPLGGSDTKEPACVQGLVLVPAGENPYPNKHAYPFMAAIINRDKRAQFCGGSLIGSKHILTAAHCFDHYRTSASLKNLGIFLGSHDLSKSELSRKEYRVSKIYKHAGFNHKTLRDDIAIVELSERVPFSKYVQPICLVPSTVKSYEDGSTKATLAGWGQTCFQRCSTSPVLRHVNVRVWTNQQCNLKYGAARRMNPAIPAISSRMLCTGSPGADACNGDSGGPAFIGKGNRYQQIGIVSFGIGCGDYPGVYTRVESYKPWILKNIRK